MPIAIPQEGPIGVKRTLGSMMPHPAAIGKIMGAKTGIAAPRMHLAGGGIADTLPSNMFQPVNELGNQVPDTDINIVGPSPLGQIGQGPGTPKPPSSTPAQQPNSMQEIAQGTGAVNGLTTLGGNASSGLGFSPFEMSADDANAYNAQNGLTAGMDDFASEGDIQEGSGLMGWLGSLFQAAPEVAMDAAKGGTVPHRDSGGPAEGLANSLMRRESQETYHPGGFLNSAGPGRTDTINTNVPTGSYVVPADVVSGLGEGNSLAGSAVIDRMFGTNPHGIASPHIKEGRGVKLPPNEIPSSRPESPPTGVQPGPTVNTAAINNAGSYAKGGKAESKPDMAPVVVAGGEHVLSPRQIISKFGSLKRGHKILDHWVVMERQRIAKEMLKLAPPVGSKVKLK